MRPRMTREISLSGLILVVAAAACAPAPVPGSNQAAHSVASTPARTLSIVVRLEPPAIAESTSGVTMNYVGQALFTADLSLTDSQEVHHPQLAQALPELNTESWRVFPDGRMETVYRLRPGLTWHDGKPLTAEDFLLGHQSRVARIGWGLSNPSLEVRATEEVLAPDARTILVRWRHPYPNAGSPGLSPLPRHVLAGPLEQGSSEAYASHPHWTTEYVGAGPYQLARWEAGAFIEGAAFDRYVLGRPKIERVLVTWTADPNVALTRLLAADVDMAADTTLQFQQAAVLRQQWAADNKGAILLSPTQQRYLITQQRPEFANPRALLDVRVRKAALHAIDRKSLAETMLEGEGIVAESMIPSTVGFYSLVDRIIPRYQYDLRQAAELMAEAGFVRGPDGVYTSPSEGRFTTGVRGLSEGQEAQETTIVVDYLRRAGVDATLDLLPSAFYSVNRDEKLSTYPALRTTYATLVDDFGMDKFVSSNIARAETSWRGTNRTGWSNAGFDRVSDAFTKELDGGERNRQMAELAKIMNDDLPALPMYFNFAVVAHLASLRGPRVAGPTTTVHGNVHEWEWR